jgi:hypothetical protein
MDHKHRYKRLRLLVKKVNKKRKEQAKKIDILCNNLIAAQRDFLNKLNTICFAANFYESIIGTTDLNSLLYTSSKLIKDEIPDSNIAFFLRQQETFELHPFEGDRSIWPQKHHLENFFTSELVENICKSNKICTIDDMLAMGLQLNINMLNKISAATIPLRQIGLSVGFILIYRSSQNKLSPDELENISSIVTGLSRMIESYRVHVNYSN